MEIGRALYRYEYSFTDRAVQIHGGNGITKDFGVELLFRNARMMTIPDGTTHRVRQAHGRARARVERFVTGRPLRNGREAPEAYAW